MTDPRPPHGPSPDPGGSPPAADPALRRQADAAYRARTAGLPDPFEASLPEAAQALVHELRVHQIELEMQNEELRRTQVELAATRARYFDLFDLAPVGYLLVRESGLILQANLTVAAMLGEVRGALTDRPVSRSIFQADQDAYYLCRKRLADTGEPQSCELRVVKPDGQHLWVLVAMSAACADDGTPLHRVTLTDIGESKRAEASFRASEERLRVALTAAAAIGFVWDAASDAVVRYFSTVPSLPVNVDAPEPVAAVRARVHPDDVGLFDAGVAECLGEGTAYRNLYRVVDPDGSERWLQEWGTLSRDFAGRPLRLTGISIDVTDRKRAEAALRESEERFRAMADAAPVLIWMADTTRRCVWFNRQWLEFVGREMVRETGDGWVENVHPDDVDRCFSTYAEAFAARRPFTMEYRLRRHDGEYRWLLDTGVPRFDAGGEFAGYIGSCVDVTERKRAEEALRESEFRLRSFMEFSPILAWIVSPDGRFLFSNHGFARLLKTSTEEVERSTVQDMFPPKYAAEYLANNRRVLEAAAPIETIERSTRQDGTEGVFLAYKFPVPTPDGSRQIGGVAVDITEQKRAEAALRESEERLRLALAAGRMGTFDWDMTTDRIVWSDTHYDLFGYPPGDRFPVEFRHFADRLHPDDRPAVDRVIREAWETGRPYTNESRIVLPDGTVRWMLGSGEFRYDPNGRPVRMLGTAIDITERKHAEQALRASEERLRLALTAGRRGIFDWDLATNAVVWSDTHYELFGYPSGERFPVEYHDFTDRVHPDDLPAVEQAIRTSMEQHTTYTSEYRLLLPDGTVRWILCTGEFQYASDGRPVRMLGIVSDITDRKQAEEALLASEARAPAVINCSPVPMALNDDAQRITFLNHAFTRTFGYELADIPTLADWWPKAYPDPAYRQWVAEAWQAELTRSAQTGTAFASMDLTIRCKDGTDRFVAANAATLADTFARTHLVVLHDITERRQAEAELVMRDRAIQAVNQGIVITDATLRDNPLVYVSPGFEKMTGYTSAEAVGRNCRFLQGPDTDRAEVARIAAAVRGGVPCSGELLNYRKDGSPLWNELSITPVRDPDGRLVHFVGIQTEVTARRSLEDQLRQAQKMEAVGRLAGGVAHDFNNLLTVINGYGALLLSELPKGDPHRECVAAIGDAGERAARLTKQLLAFSRKTILTQKVLDLRELVEESAMMLRRLIGEEIVLAVINDPAPMRVNIDRGQIEQVIMNLVLNARDAMPNGGRVTIEMRIVASAGGDLTPFARLSVSDTGQGMTEEVKSRVFEPFFTTKGVGQGTGLGLAVVHGVVTQCGGRLSVESTVGVGTTFGLFLPLVENDADWAGAETARLSTHGTETVLLVEDEDAVRTIARISLESQNYTVLEADGGAEALRLAETHPGEIHLLVSDVVMPGMGGRQVVEGVRLYRPAVRVLFMSGYTDDAVFLHGVLEATDVFIQKPFTPLSLARKVREVLDAPTN